MNPLYQPALLRLVRNNRSSANRDFTAVEAQVGLTGVLVGAVATPTVRRENRLNIASVIDRFGILSFGQNHIRPHNSEQQQDSESKPQSCESRLIEFHDLGMQHARRESWIGRGVGPVFDPNKVHSTPIRSLRSPGIIFRQEVV